MCPKPGKRAMEDVKMRSRIIITALLIIIALALGPILFAGDGGEENDPLFPGGGGGEDGDDGKEKAKPEDDAEPVEPAEEADDGRCKACTEKKMCDEHKAKEKEAIERLREFNKIKCRNSF